MLKGLIGGQKVAAVAEGEDGSIVSAISAPHGLEEGSITTAGENTVDTNSKKESEKDSGKSEKDKDKEKKSKDKKKKDKGDKDDEDKEDKDGPDSKAGKKKKKKKEGQPDTKRELLQIKICSIVVENLIPAHRFKKNTPWLKVDYGKEHEWKSPYQRDEQGERADFLELDWEFILQRDTRHRDDLIVTVCSSEGADAVIIGRYMLGAGDFINIPVTKSGYFKVQGKVVNAMGPAGTFHGRFIIVSSSFHGRFIIVSYSFHIRFMAVSSFHRSYFIIHYFKQLVDKNVKHNTVHTVPLTPCVT